VPDRHITVCARGQSAGERGGDRVTASPHPSEHDARLPAAIDAVIAKGMAKDPADRYQTATQLAAAARALGVRSLLTQAAAEAPRPAEPPAAATEVAAR